MKCAVYVRFSEAELQKETSADDQLRECRRYAERQGWTIVCEYVDRGVRANNVVKRLELMRLKRDAAAGLFEVVLLWEMSRWARNLMRGLADFHEITQHGIKIAETKLGLLDPNHFMGAMQLSMALAVAQGESAQLSDRARRGAQGQIERGYSHGGRMYGYRGVEEKDARARRVGVRFEVFDPEAEIVRRMFTIFVDGASYHQIAKSLNKESVLAPAGHAWSASTVRSILGARRYIGERVFGVTSRTGKVSEGTGKKLQKRNAAPSTINGSFCPTVIDRELWDRAQARRQSIGDLYRGKSGGAPRGCGNRRHLLTGFLECGLCQSTLEVTKEKSRHVYRCLGRKKKGDVFCKNKLYVRKDDLELIVQRVVNGFYRDPEVLGRVVDEHNARARSAAAERDRALSQLEAQLKENGQRQANIATAIASGEAPRALLDLLLQLEADATDLEKRRADLVEMTFELLDAVEIGAGAGDGSMFTGDIERDRKTLERCITRVRVGPGEFVTVEVPEDALFAASTAARPPRSNPHRHRIALIEPAGAQVLPVEDLERDHAVSAIAGCDPVIALEARWNEGDLGSLIRVEADHATDRNRGSVNVPTGSPTEPRIVRVVCPLPRRVRGQPVVGGAT